MYAGYQRPISQDLVDLSHVKRIRLCRHGARQEIDRLGYEAVKGKKEPEEQGLCEASGDPDGGIPAGRGDLAGSR